MKLKEFRTRKGYSQLKLAKKLGVSRSTVSMWEIGESQPDIDMLVKLANLFEVSMDDLLEREQPDTEKAAPQEEQPKANTIKILGRDGSCVERKLSDDQIDLMKRMIEQMPDENDL